jgi:hypothetical protein
LTFTAWDLEAFAQDCGYNGPPFCWDQERRFLLRCEIEAAFFHLYGIGREDVIYVLDTFPVVKRKDVEKFGEYRTQRVILEAYDALAEAGRTGKVYQTKLEPEPGPPIAALPTWIAGQERPTGWPEHIHPPRDHPQPSGRRNGARGVVQTEGILDTDRIIQAFTEVREGASVDYVIACPEMNTRFLTRVRELGAVGRDIEVNLRLLNARKAGRLKGARTGRSFRLPPVFEPWVFVSEWATRHLQRLLVRETDRLVALDEILCNPEFAARFDELAKRIKAGFSSLEYRWGALGLRKKGKARPDARTLKIEMDQAIPVEEALRSALNEAGLYLLRAGDRSVFINAVPDLRNQLRRHLDLAGKGLVPEWLMDEVGEVDTVACVYLAGATQDILKEVRITSVASCRPWLNLLDLEGTA